MVTRTTSHNKNCSGLWAGQHAIHVAGLGCLPSAASCHADELLIAHTQRTMQSGFDVPAVATITPLLLHLAPSTSSVWVGLGKWWIES
jgi:hypothetical protein